MPRLQLNYDIDLEARQQRDNRYLSTIGLQLKDDFSAHRLKMNYDLNGRYLYEHNLRQENTLWLGQGTVDYRISRSLSALANLNLVEVASPGVTVDDVLTTQTLANGRIGLQWRTADRRRSQFRVLAEEHLYRYQNSTGLDADEDRMELEYRYRLSEQSGYSLAYQRFAQRYRNGAQSALDTDTGMWQLGFDKRWSRVGVEWFANSRKVEFVDGGSDRFDGYGMELSHQPNSRNRLSMRLGRDVQQAFRFNTTLGNGLNRLEDAGLVETDSLRLDWSYRGRFSAVTLTLYQDDIQVLSGPSANTSGRQKGGSLSLRRDLTEKFRAELNTTFLDNDFTGNRTRLTELSFIYQWVRARNIDLSLNLQGRQGDEAGQVADDVSLIIQGRARLIP